MNRRTILHTALVITAGLLLCTLPGTFPLPSSVWTGAHAAQIVENPYASPKIIYAGVPTRVWIRVSISRDPNLIDSSVNLLRLNPNGTTTILDKLYDDGTHGDGVAKDGGFINKLELNEPVPTTLRFQVSVGYKGQARRVLSDVFTVEVLPLPKLEDLWNQFVAKMAKGELSAVSAFFHEATREDYQKDFDTAGSADVAATYRTVRDFKLTMIEEYSAKASFIANHRGTEKRGQVVFQMDVRTGEWKLFRVGFLGKVPPDGK